MIPQSIIDLAEICVLKGVRDVVISPGSRNAPLTIAFSRHPEIRAISVPDERSAAFIALGMSLKSGSTTALVCTSGSAAYNYAPAIAEAHFSNIPLLVLTADRPPEWIDQLDGQTIHQENIYGSHVKRFIPYPAQDNYSNALWFAHRLANEAINLAQQDPKGPVHLNIPFREPFYPDASQKLIASPDIKIIKESNEPGQEQLTGEDFKEYKKILIVLGQMNYDQNTRDGIRKIIQNGGVPVVADVIANMSGIDGVIQHQDVFLRSKKHHGELFPDLIVSFGKSVISKNLKLFLRSANGAAHWHVQSDGYVADTFQKLSRVIKCEAIQILETLANLPVSKEGTFYSSWKNLDKQCDSLLDSLLQKADFSEFTIYHALSRLLPDTIDLHLANSMAVRYVNFFGLSQKQISVFCNRGTSGIDGSVSTAIGSGLKSNRTTLLITGDMAFFYDRNAFWHQELPDNVKIIVVNNHGGGIFRLIDGPGKQPELETFFETKQHLTARHLASEFGFDYHLANDHDSFTVSFSEFIKPRKTISILEIETYPTTNKMVYDQILNSITENLN